VNIFANLTQPHFPIKERGILFGKKKRGLMPLLNTRKDMKPMFLTVLEKV